MLNAIAPLMKYLPETRIETDMHNGIMSHRDLHRRRIGAIFGAGAVVCLIFVVARYSFSPLDSAAIADIATGSIAAVMCIYAVWLALWAKHYDNSLRLILLLFSALAWCELILSGGIGAPSAAIIPVIPVVAALLLKPKDAITLAGLHIAVLVLVAYLFVGRPLIPALDISVDQAPTLMLSMAIIAITASAGSALYMAYQNQRVEGQLRELLIHQAYLAVHDYLSGLGNRVQLQQRFADTPEGDEFDLLLIDLDGFKAVNDTFGHKAGDHLIKSVADRLRELVDEDDMAVRLGGDEFVLLLQSLDMKPAEVRNFGDSVVEILSRPYPWNGQVLRISASIGHARFPLHAGTPGEALGLADKALYDAKEAGKGRCVTTGVRATRAPKRSKPRFTLPSPPHSRILEADEV